jgi:hypothetical protein
MSEEEILYHNDYISKAKELHDIKDLEQRVKDAAELGRKYNKNLDMIKSGLTEEFITAFDFVKLGEMQKKIHDAHKEKKKILSDIEAEELLKDALMEILPRIKYGTTDRDTNFQAFEGYMAMMTNYENKPQQDIMAAIKRGDGRVAVNAIIDAMANLKVAKATQQFNRYLMPDDHLEFKEVASKYITKETNKYIKGKGELKQGEVTKKINDAFSDYIQGNYGKMVQQYGGPDQTKKPE